eukprot:6136850-Amphidinium_carterae.1
MSFDGSSFPISAEVDCERSEAKGKVALVATGNEPLGSSSLARGATSHSCTSAMKLVYGEGTHPNVVL